MNVQPRTIHYVPVEEAVRADRNPRTHDIEYLRSLILRFGFVDGAIHDGRTGKLIAGHGRLETLQEMQARGDEPPEGVVRDAAGRWLMPVQHGWSSRSDTEAEALLVGLNRATEVASWVRGDLDELLRGLNEEDPDLVTLAGFELPQPQDVEPPTFQPEDDGTRLDQKKPVECPSCGHRWRVGVRGKIEPC